MVSGAMEGARLTQFYVQPMCTIGKWHLGHADRKRWPRQRGFDYQYGAMIGELDYFTHDSSS